MDAIVAQNLTHTYPPKRPSKVAQKALRGVSFTVSTGELFGLLGPNGGGKSTTFHILSTFFTPTSGSVMLFGKDAIQHPDAVRRDLGIVFQTPGLDIKLTVQENLTHQGHLYGLSGTALKQRIIEVLTRLGVDSRKDSIVETLSGGLRRRVEIAKGLLHHPKLLLLDEPTAGLDPASRRDLWNYLFELKTSERMTLVVTTHLMDEADKCDRVAIINEGVLVSFGTPAALKLDIGGDVISLGTADTARLSGEIEKKYHVTTQVIGQSVRFERAQGHEFIPQVIADFPGLVHSVTLNKPTLEDVFIKKTGHRLSSDPL